MDRLEAASEWLVNDAATGAAVAPKRFAATVGEFTEACGTDELPVQPDDPDTRPDLGPSVQLLLRKRPNTPDYQLLVNGRVAQPPKGGTEYVLPPFQIDATLREDATGRHVPSPVIVGLLVEEGALAPDRVLVQVCQRTFVNGAQVDSGSESVAMETELPVTRPSDNGARCVAVGYPMALGPPPTVEITDNARAERVEASDKQKRVRDILLGLGNAWGGNWLTAFSQFAQQMSNGAVLASAVLASLGALPAALFKNQQIEKIEGGVTLLSISSRALAALLLRYLNRDTETTEERAKRAERISTISVFDMPALIERVIRYNRGGALSSMGRAPKLEDLRNARRHDDALLIDTILRLKRTEDDLKQIEAMLKDGTSNLDEKRQKGVMSKLRGLEENARPNAISLKNIEIDKLKKKGYVESFLRIQVVDSRRDGAQSRQTFQIGSGERAYFAGIVASGVQKLQTDLDETLANLALAWKFDVEPYSSPLVNPGTRSKTLLDAITGRLAGRGQARTWPDANALIATLQFIAQGIRKSLGALFDEADTQTLPMIKAGRVTRRLPHLLRIKNAAGMTFVLEQNTGVLVQGDGALGDLTDGLRTIVTSSAGTLRVVKQAIAQYLEVEGVVRERTRLVMYIDDADLDPTNLARIPERGTGRDTRATRREAARDEAEAEAAPVAATVAQLNRAVLEDADVDPGPNISTGIGTRACYAARFPREMIDALEGHAQHPQLREALTVRWLSGGNAHTPLPDSGADTALRFGLQATHEGELVASVLVDLALDDVMRRMSDATLTPAPSREQLLCSSVEYAIALLRNAGELARGAFGKGLDMRIDADDAFYACYPGGEALLRVLHESAVWREWRAPWTKDTAYSKGGKGDRFALLDASLSARPTGAASLARMLEMLPALKVPKSTLLCEAPHLSALSMLWFTSHELPMVLPDGSFTPSDPRSATWACVWLALAAQTEASVDAAHRVSVMASGLGLPPEVSRSLLRESAFARPIVGLAVRVDPANGPRTARAGLEMLDEPLARVGDDPSQRRELQPKVPRLPLEGTLLDTRVAECQNWLCARLATLRFNVRELAREPALSFSTEEILTQHFAGLGMHKQPPLMRVDYLCAFGNAYGAEPNATVGRHFEDVKIYSRLLMYEAVGRPRANAPVMVLRPRGDHENVHPLLVRLHAAIGKKRPRIDAKFVHVPEAVQSFPDSGRAATAGRHTLRDYWAAAQSASTLPSLYAVGVDAASCLLHNVERITQALLVMTAHGYGKESVLMVMPPKLPAVKEVYEVPPPSESPQLPTVRRQVYILLLTLKGLDALAALVHSDNQADRDAYVKRMGDDEQFDPRKPDGQKTYIDGILEAVTKAGVVNEQLEAALGALIAGATDVRDRATVKGYYDSLASMASASPANRARLEAASKFLEAWKDYDEKLLADRGKTADANIYARKENERRRAAAAQARAHEIRLWPMACTIAHAAIGALLTSVPMPFVDLDNLVDNTERATVRAASSQFSRAVKAWAERGLRAMPLCELVAVVSRLQWVRE